MSSKKVPSSFRDPSGFLFIRDGLLYRQINKRYKDNYDKLINSGLYKTLVDAQLLIPHEEVDIKYRYSPEAYKVVKPEPISFISYPYEWCFSQLKDAALTTLRIQKIALEFGMCLKDCSAYNIQFRNGKPVLIDTLSFEEYEEGKPWVAYRQFCQHFLAPLALMSYTDVRLSQLFRIYIDGIPLDMASSILPFRTRFKFSLFSHIHLHAKAQKYFAHKTVDVKNKKMNLLSFQGFLENLESTIKNLEWKPKGTQWADYYEISGYSPDALSHKKQIVANFLERVNPKSVWDLGANIGIFSRIASKKGIPTISFDMDPAAVEKNYLECKRNKETNILPLLLDLTNPSPSIGWANEERLSFLERGPADAVFALALIHHLAISNNLPFNKIAEFLFNICNWLIVEFIPKNDPQVQRLLASREDIFFNYNQQAFEKEFKKRFNILERVKIKDSCRILYLMHKI